ncbi:hypothetical protein SGPA1_40471 [Streptomyces misionensis JCM 4497]
MGPGPAPLGRRARSPPPRPRAPGPFGPLRDLPHPCGGSRGQRGRRQDRSKGQQRPGRRPRAHLVAPLPALAHRLLRTYELVPAARGRRAGPRRPPRPVPGGPDLREPRAEGTGAEGSSPGRGP